MEQEEAPGFALLDEADSPAPGKKKDDPRRELLVGLLLLVVVVGWGGWDFWQNRLHESLYRDGGRYAAAYNWEAARDSYLAAGGYGNAAQLAADASRNIASRDKLYSAATTSIAAGSWAPALRDLRGLQEIQPSYRDSATLLPQAEKGVADGALLGAVAMRRDADPPGLYLYTTTGWQLLDGSDRMSAVYGSGDSCCVLYDVPGNDASNVESSTTRRLPIGRSLMLAEMEGDALQYTAIALNPNDYHLLHWSRAGLLALRYNEASTIGVFSPNVDTTYANATLDFQAHDSSTLTQVTLPGTSWLVLNPDAGDGALLVADYNAASGNMARTGLYLLVLGDEPSLLVERPGVITSAERSPAGDYLLLTEHQFLADSPLEEERLVLVSLAGAAKATVLAHKMGGPPTVSLLGGASGQFVAGGPLAGRLLLSENYSGSAKARLVDPAAPEQTLWSATGASAEAFVFPRPLATGALVIFDSGEFGPHTTYYIGADLQAQQLKLGFESNEQLQDAWVEGDRLIYKTATARRDPEAPPRTTIRSLILPTGAQDPLEETLLYSESTGLSSDYTNSQAWHVGPSLLAYSQDGQLRVRSYDGLVDILLESGSTIFYPTGN